MKKEVKCENCTEELVILTEALFFSSEAKSVDIDCPNCNSNIAKEKTDGWFFVQIKNEYLKTKKIDEDNEKLKYPMA